MTADLKTPHGRLMAIVERMNAIDLAAPDATDQMRRSMQQHFLELDALEEQERTRVALEEHRKTRRRHLRALIHRMGERAVAKPASKTMRLDEMTPQQRRLILALVAAQNAHDRAAS